jgi:hypothetical protein
MPEQFGERVRGGKGHQRDYQSQRSHPQQFHSLQQKTFKKKKKKNDKRTTKKKKKQHPINDFLPFKFHWRTEGTQRIFIFFLRALFVRKKLDSPCNREANVPLSLPLED